MMHYQLFEAHKNLVGFTTERDGGVSVGNYQSLNLCHYVNDNPEHVARNRQIVCEQLGIDAAQLIFPRQTHSNHLLVIDEKFLKLTAKKQTALLEGVDALITVQKSICIGINTADCVPVLLFDPERNVIAVAHAGWRGTVARIAAKTAQQMIQEFQCRAENLLVAIGPSISAANYEVGNDVLAEFVKADFPTGKCFTKAPNSDKLQLDLWAANRWQLEELGILPEHIEVAGICTFDQADTYFSARKLGIHSGRIASCLMMK